MKNNATGPKDAHKHQMLRRQIIKIAIGPFNPTRWYYNTPENGIDKMANKNIPDLLINVISVELLRNGDMSWVFGVVVVECEHDWALCGSCHRKYSEAKITSAIRNSMLTVLFAYSIPIPKWYFFLVYILGDTKFMLFSWEISPIIFYDYIHSTVSIFT